MATTTLTPVTELGHNEQQFNGGFSSDIKISCVDLEAQVRIRADLHKVRSKKHFPLLEDICPQLLRISQLCLWGSLHLSLSPSASLGLQSPAPLLLFTHKPQTFKLRAISEIAATPQSIQYSLWYS